MAIKIFFMNSAGNPETRINIDRPFIFVVRDMKHNIPVLVGRIVNPAEGL
jgi:serine protease inhibitor